MDTIRGHVDRHAGHNPQSVAVLAAGRPPLTYEGLGRQIHYVGEKLALEAVGPTGRVALILPEGAEAAVAIVAVAANAACAPLNPAWPASELEAQLSALGAQVLIVPHGWESPLLALAASLNIRILQLVSQPDAAAGTFSLTAAGRGHRGDQPLAAPDDAALLLFTSGTSARPKLVPLTHRNLCVSARNICSAVDLRHTDRCLGMMPLFHIHGISSLLSSLVCGGSYISVEGFSADRFFSCLSDLKPTWYTASPAMHRTILDQIRLCREDPRQSGLRFIRSASAPMPPQLIADIESAFGVPFVEAYGMTEAAPQIASNRLPPFERKPGSVGKAAGPEIAIMDEAGRLLPPGGSGEVVIRGPNVMHDYDDRTDNQAAFIDGWLRTGDIGHLDAEGYLFVTGRLKDIINHGGEKISPRLVEQILLQHAAIGQAVVFGVPHPVLGETVAAAVVLKAGQKQFTPVQQIRGFVAERLARSKVPQWIVVVDEIPADSSGKVNRKHLALTLDPQQQEAQRDPPQTGKVIARTATERRVAAVFAEVLGIEPPGIHDDFLDLGGHSLIAMQVLARLQEIFQVTLPIDCMFERPTTARLSERIGEQMADLVADGRARLEQGSTTSTQATKHIPRRQGGTLARLSSVQKRVYFLDRMGAGGAYNMSASLWLTGPLDERALALCLDEIRRRHDILRTTFHMREGGPVQVVSEFQETRLVMIDLSGHKADARTAEARHLASQDAGEPFDLAQGPLFRAKLIRLTSDEHVLLLTMHHIVSDGWSIGVLYTELRQLYEAFHDDRASPLDDLPLQYGDFAAWQQHGVEAGEFERQTGYWIRQLNQMPPAFTLPTDRPRPAIQSYRGGTIQALINRQTTDRLKALGQSHNATVFMTFLAAFKTLLHRYNGQDDCAVGVPIANRPSKELEPLIGFFANTLVLRTPLAGDPSFLELLGRVRSTALDAYAHQDVPLERIVEQLNIPRDPRHAPLFQVMFAFQNIPGLPGSVLPAQSATDHVAGPCFDLAQGLSAQPVRIDKVTAKFDLTLYLSETPEGMSATWQFNADLYEPATIDRLARHFQTLLESIGSDPGQRLSELSLLPEVDRRQIEIDWNHTEASELLGQDYVQLFEAQVERTPDATAVLGGDRQFTYRELNERASRFARYFRSRGVARETLTAICLPRSAEMLAVLLGVWKAGGAFLPLDPEHPSERIAFMLRDAGVSLLITETSLLPKFPSTFQSMAIDSSDHTRTICIDACHASLALQDSHNVGTIPASDALAYVIYTSGSTGKPKGAMITQANVGHYAQAMVRAVAIRPDDIYLHTASFSFSSSIRQFAVPLSCGAAVAVASAEELRDPHLLFEMVRHQRVSVLDLVPSFSAVCLQVLMSLDQPVRASLLDNQLRLVLSASEPLPSALIEKWRHLCRPGTRFVNMFGQTETTGIVMIYPVPAEGGAAKVVPIGRPIANTQAYVLDTSRRPVPVGIGGHLYVGGAGIGAGYINHPEHTAKNFVRNPFSPHDGARLHRTGDLARYRPDGTIEILGRADEQVKIRGFRIELGEIEAAIHTHQDVRECVVGVVEDAAADDNIGDRKRLVAFVAANEQHDAPVPALSGRLREFLKQQLPEYMLPQRIVMLQRLPRTSNGKVDRRALLTKEAQTARSTVATHPSSRVDLRVVAPTDDETILTGVWKKVLRLDEVGLHDNFFDLGGNSILSINVVVEASRAGLHVDLRQLYQHQTITDLARAVAQARHDIGPTVAAAPASSGNGGKILVTIESLRAYGREALTRAGLSLKGAEIVAEVQLEASLRGQPTHDMVSIPRYAVRIASGKINADPQIRIEHETTTIARIDGDNGPGQWVSTVAMDLAIQKAGRHGVGIVGVRRSNHFGAAGHYVWQAAKNGLIGLCTTNGPLILAPTGGVTPTFGNNPLGVGIPAGRHFPILLDVAMSVAPRGKIGLSVAEGSPLPPGWILDRSGRPSTDLGDLAAGLGVPIGGHKGYGLALVMEVLAGVLSGAGFGSDHHQDRLRESAQAPDYGHFFMALDPQRFMPASEFTERVDRLIEQTRNGERAEGATEILIPGEMELRAREESLREGVRLRSSTYRALVAYGRKAKLDAELSAVTENQLAEGHG
ncbi:MULTISPECIES: non-ribosomal peptide synthetase [unclassified Mesorhizobium]|uniref:non-ribosomal peptide synthetase n=1 Tax=unclassified Mesorhizobium TaxID=325217 RepID=UPI000FD31C63|nr:MULTISPECIES: non-ribosomal peptide synthetase [unclassified Mesorhizobium]RVB78743.1 amino acid adenylation domain-containing protein [Mesorhizobium sp. M6A.T.Cr.TU.014.01.1.1]RWQ09215.1 MAG: amino acid adenylation domain-containing protein [Mesorhizobium sp.]RWQ12031.1 MAG: amino acid adenylation domain-containing protein [Mesorhizobium sp.]